MPKCHSEGVFDHYYKAPAGNPPTKFTGTANRPSEGRALASQYMGLSPYMLNPSGVAFEYADYPRIEASNVNPPKSVRIPDHSKIRGRRGSNELPTVRAGMSANSQAAAPAPRSLHTAL